MSIWGKVIGGVAGFTMGGPLGALMGAVAGHAYDKMKAEGASPGAADAQTQQIAFTTAVIVLSAKMAKADGRVTRDEVDAFKELFQIPADEMKNVGKLFDEAKKDAKGFEPYAALLAGAACSGFIRGSRPSRRTGWNTPSIRSSAGGSFMAAARRWSLIKTSRTAVGSARRRRSSPIFAAPVSMT